jgi:hypothetical protein
VKNNLICSPQKRILWLSRTYDGATHDKKIADEEAVCFPKRITLWQDTGFQGHHPEKVNIRMPTKKPRGKELSAEQKTENKKISSYRIKVEHAIGGVKTYRIVKERFRCTKLNLDYEVLLIVCGLYNFKISSKNNA